MVFIRTRAQIIIRNIRRKVFIFYSLFVIAPKTWERPTQSDFLFFDGAGAKEIARFLPNDSYAVLYLRGEVLSIPCLVRSMFSRKFWRFRVLEAYIDAFIQASSPKVLITLVDNQVDFYRIKCRNPELVTIVIQGNYRAIVGDIFQFLKPDEGLQVDYMFVFGRFIGDHYRKFVSCETIINGSFVNNIVPVKVAAKNGTVLFISQWRPKPKNPSRFLVTPNGRFLSWEEFYAAESTVLSFLSEWCRASKKELLVCGCSRNADGDEERFYADRISLAKYRFIPKSDPYSSYRRVDSAELIVFIDSSLGYEALARGKRVAALCCRNIDMDAFSDSFGWPGELPKNGLFWTNERSRVRFQEILNYLSSVSESDWRVEWEKYGYEICHIDPENSALKKCFSDVLNKGAHGAVN